MAGQEKITIIIEGADAAQGVLERMIKARKNRIEELTGQEQGKKNKLG